MSNQMSSTRMSPVPTTNYGILIEDGPLSQIDDIAEQVKRIGYAVLESGFTSAELDQLSEVFDSTRAIYLSRFGEGYLRGAKEFHTIRAPLTFGDPMFVILATNPNLMAVLEKLIVGKFILNQQNGVINPPGENYNQGSWHRDLPFQHYVSSTPLAVNALFCVDDFNLQNGSTFVLPASHKTVNFPSDSYIRRNAKQLEAKAGQYIVMDCMLYHSGGFNDTDKERRAVNHVFSIPYFKQQIKLPELLKHLDLTSDYKELFGFNSQEPTSIDQYLAGRNS